MSYFALQAIVNLLQLHCQKNLHCACAAVVPQDMCRSDCGLMRIVSQSYSIIRRALQVLHTLAQHAHGVAILCDTLAFSPATRIAWARSSRGHGFMLRWPAVVLRCSGRAISIGGSHHHAGHSLVATEVRELAWTRIRRDVAASATRGCHCTR